MSAKSAAERIQELKSQIAELENQAVQELREKERQLLADLEAVRSEIAELTGETSEAKAVKGPKAAKGPKNAGKLVSLDRLKELIGDAEGKTLYIRKEGLDLENVKKLVAENPKVLTLGGNKPWFTVSLNK